MKNVPGWRKTRQPVLLSALLQCEDGAAQSHKLKELPRFAPQQAQKSMRNSALNAPLRLSLSQANYFRFFALSPLATHREGALTLHLQGAGQPMYLQQRSVGASPESAFRVQDSCALRRAGEMTAHDGGDVRGLTTI